MTGKKYLILAVTFWILAMTGIIVYDHWKIDGCLDAGGSFDYVKFLCDQEESHPSSSYLVARIPVFAGVTVALAAYFYLIFHFVGKALGWHR